MYWIFYRPGEEWVESGPHSTEQALQSYANLGFLYGVKNIKFLQELPNMDEAKHKLTIDIGGMGTAVSPPDDEESESDIEPVSIDSKEVDEQLVEEANESLMSNWNFLARIARIKTMLVRVCTETESWCGYFVGVGSNDGMYSVLKHDCDGENVKIYYEDIASIEFLEDNES